MKFCSRVFEIPSSVERCTQPRILFPLQSCVVSTISKHFVPRITTSLAFHRPNSNLVAQIHFGTRNSLTHVEDRLIIDTVQKFLLSVLYRRITWTSSQSLWITVVFRKYLLSSERSTLFPSDRLQSLWATLDHVNHQHCLKIPPLCSLPMKFSSPLQLL